MSYYPPQVLTKVKSADEIKDTVDEMVEADSELTLSLPAGNWLLSARLYMTPSLASGLRIIWTGTNVTLPTSMRIARFIGVPPETVSDPAYAYIRDFNTETFDIAATGTDRTLYPVQLDLNGDLVIAAASASITMYWCEDLQTDGGGAGTGGPVTMKKRSFIQAVRL